MEITLDLAKKQRPLKNLPINMKITGWISPYLIYLFSILSIHPNLITLTWIVLAFIGFYFIALGNYTNMVVGILIYHFALLLDSSDGGVARILGKTNAGGEFLDRFFSTINRSLILLVIGFGLFRVRQDTLFLYLGIFSAIFLNLENLIKLKGYEALINSNRFDIIKKKIKKNRKTRHNIKFYIYEAFRPGNHFTLSFFAIIFSLADLYLYIFSVLIFFQTIYVFTKEFFILKHTKQNLLSKQKF